MSEWSKLAQFGKRTRAAPLALASVVRTHGSSYRRAGARMLVTADGKSMGGVSGGCLEDEVIDRADRVLRDGIPQLCTFETRVRQGCHGSLEVLIEALAPEDDLLETIEARQKSRRVALLETTFGRFHSPRRCSRLISSVSEESALVAQLGGRDFLPEQLTTEILHSDASSSLLELIPPPIRLVMVGSGRDSVPLVELARQMGWTVEVVAHPTDQAALPITFAAHSALDALPSLAPDAWTAVVLISHHYARDLEYLQALLPLSIPYLGMLGSRKRREQLLAELMDAGFELTPERLSKLRSPAGLDLGGESPAEIALSIVAEIRAVMSGRDGTPLSRRKGGIHAPHPSQTS